MELTKEFSIEEFLMAEKLLMKCSMSLAIMEIQIKTILDFILHPSEWLRSKPQVTAYVVEDMDQGEHSSIPNGSVKSYKASVNQSQ